MRCISTPAKAIDNNNDSTSAPTMAQKSAAMSLAFAGVLMQRMVKRHAHREDSQ